MTGATRGRGAPTARRGGRVQWLLKLLLMAAGAYGAGRRSRGGPPAPAPQRALPGRPRLVTVFGGHLPHGEAPVPPETVLRAGRLVLGRARDADLLLRDPTVSPRHALVEADGEGRVRIRDLGALNGVSVDGVPMAEAELHDGNRVSLGAVQLVYRTDPVRDDGGRSGGELGENLGS